MGVNEEGFLGSDMLGYVQRIKERHKDSFDLVARVNRLCHENKFRMKIHNLDGQEIFATGLFMKCLADCQGAVVLLARGMSSQARTLLRTAAEALVKLGKVCSDEAFVKAYLLVGERERLKMVRAIRKNAAPAFDEVRTEITEDLIAEIARNVDGNMDKGTVETWAKQLGLSQRYDGAYRLFSIDVHSGPRCLQRYLKFGDEGQLSDVSWGPDLDENLNAELLDAASVMLNAMAYIDTLFSLDLKNKLMELAQELRALDEPAQSDGAAR